MRIPGEDSKSGTHLGNLNRRRRTGLSLWGGVGSKISKHGEGAFIRKISWRSKEETVAQKHHEQAHGDES